MQTVILGIVIVGASVVLAYVGLVLVRRSVSLERLKSHQEVAGFIFGAVGVIYSVLLAFLVIVVWEQYEEARTNVAEESNKIVDLALLAQGMPEPLRGRALAGLEAYGEQVVGEEWPGLARGENNPRVQATTYELWRVYTDSPAEAERVSSLYDASLERLSELTEKRRLRVHASDSTLSPLMWVLLVGGGIVTVAFTYFFAVENFRSQALMTGALAGVIAFVVFLIAALDNPFRGDLSVSPTPMRHAVERVRELSALSRVPPPAPTPRPAER